jgi:hypothetical protein
MNTHISASYTTIKSVTAALNRCLENIIYNTLPLETWRDKFGVEFERTAEPEALGIKPAFFQLDNNGLIEIVVSTNDQSAVGRTLESRSEGIHKDNHKDNHNEQVRR